MGVEMTALLRALAFIPRARSEPEVPDSRCWSHPRKLVMTPTQVPQQQPAPAQQQQNVPLSDATSQVLAARSQLQRAQGATKAKE